MTLNWRLIGGAVCGLIAVVGFVLYTVGIYMFGYYRCQMAFMNSLLNQVSQSGVGSSETEEFDGQKAY